MISGLNHITLSVSDLDRSLSFYTRLGFVPEVRWNSGAYLSLGELWLCFTLGETTPRSDYSHLAFTVQENLYAAAAQQLTEAGVEEWQENSSEGQSLYFFDPDEHKLEIHVGGLESRLHELDLKPYDGLVYLNRERGDTE